MKISDVIAALNLTLVSGEGGIDNTINGGYASDLLSDVIGNAEQGQVWVTLQNHINTIAIASLKDLAGIILVNNNHPDAKAISKSNEEQIPVMITEMPAFEVIGKLYELLKQNDAV